MMNSNPPVGAIAYGRSGVGGIITEIEAEACAPSFGGRVVLKFPDGLLKRVPISAIVHWELPAARVKRRKLDLGVQVRYIGTDRNLVKQYAGVLEVWEMGKGGDSGKCTCLKPNGRTTSWIEFSDLELVEVSRSRLVVNIGLNIM